MSPQRQEANMQIKHILRDKGREVVTISAEATLSEAASTLARKQIGALVVHGDDGAIAGIISERDLIHALAEASVAALAQSVSAHMSRSVVTASESDTVDELMEVMTRNRFRHVPVVEQGRLIGIVSIGDVVKSCIAETTREAETLRGYIAAG
jgi:CBS domain-containing protein